MKPERAMWLAIRTILQHAHLDPVRVENPTWPGTPDVNVVPGWIELKHLDFWPKKRETPARLEHFTTKQRNWHLKRAKAGGRSWVLLRVGARPQEWLLFKGTHAAAVLGRVPRMDLYEHVAGRWSGRKPTSKELIECLSR